MTIRRDLSDLPREGSGGGGRPPDATIRFAHLLAEKWAGIDPGDGRTHEHPKSRFRHSDAGKCARYLSYAAAKLAKTDPMELSGVWNTHLGRFLHGEWQDALRASYPGADVEVCVVTLDEDGSGHGDALITLDDGREWGTEGEATTTIAYELKSIGGYGFKQAVGKASRGQDPQGPRPEHVVQGALNAYHLDADELVIGYLAKEALSVSLNDGREEAHRFCAEWTYTPDEFVPIARAELERLRGILGLIDKGQVAARKIPGVPGEITNPASGQWEQHGRDGALLTGSYWGCAYCSYRTLCAATPAGRQPLESVVGIRKAIG